MLARFVFISILVLSPAAWAQQSDEAACRSAVSLAEARFRLPTRLLSTIALVESGRPNPTTGSVAPWPWTINVGGVGHYFDSKTDAVAAVQRLQMSGTRSIDVGCMQINLMYHPNAFASIEQAFDPTANALYGARFLSALFVQTNNWPQAAAFYHSQSPGLAREYETRIMALWPEARAYPDRTLAARPDAGDDGFDLKLFTPAFAASMQQTRAEAARIVSEHTMLAVPTLGGLPDVSAPSFSAILRQAQSESARLAPTARSFGR